MKDLQAQALKVKKVFNISFTLNSNNISIQVEGGGKKNRLIEFINSINKQFPSPVFTNVQEERV
jgi:hypothetical protein